MSLATTRHGDLPTTHTAVQSSAAVPPWLELMRQAPTHSSASLGWRHIEAHRFDGLRCWNLSLPPAPKHFIAAHLLKPCHIETRWGGRVHRARSQPGNAMVMAAGQDSVWHCSDSIDELHVFLDPEILDEAAQEIGGHYFELLDGVAIVEPAIHEISMQLLAEIQRPGMGTRLFADTMSRALALQLIRRRSTARFIDAPHRICMTARQLRAATDYIESHLSRDLSLENLSAASAMSAFRFARAFKKSTGQSPRQYVITRRIERAKELLRSPRRDIADVANLVGFSTQSHFTAVFHRHCGITPKRFRDTCRS
jgi:AraC family transcriptional regulator